MQLDATSIFTYMDPIENIQNVGKNTMHEIL